jgi:hypothetical protein
MTKKSNDTCNCISDHRSLIDVKTSAATDCMHFVPVFVFFVVSTLRSIRHFRNDTRLSSGANSKSQNLTLLWFSSHKTRLNPRNVFFENNSLHSSVILLSFAESFSSGSNGFPDKLLFLLSFVSLLLLLSLLFKFADVEGPELDVDDDAAGSFLIIVDGGEPSSCLIDVTTSCSDEPTR